MEGLFDITDKEGNFKLWRVFVNFIRQKPKWFWIFLGAQFFFVLIAYAGEIGFGEAFGLALLIDFLWLIFFVFLPAVYNFIVGLVLIILTAGITFTLYKSLGIDNFFGLILLFAAVFVGVMIIISLATILLYCLPGILIGYAVYSATESSFLTVVTFLIITVGVVVLVYYFSKYVLPFIFGYGMNWISVILANQLGASIMLGFSVYTLFEGGRDFYAQPDIYGLMDMANAFSPVIGLIKAITYLPGILVFWSVISGIFFGLLNTPIRTTFMKTGEVVPKFRHLDSGNPSARPVPVATPNLVPDLLQQDSSDEIFCWNCGSKGLKNHQYCAECGADLNLGK